MLSKKYSKMRSHPFVDNALYFVTGATVDKQPFFRDDKRKQILLSEMETVFKTFGWRIDVWVIFDNHYHLIAAAHKGADLPSIIEQFHDRSAALLNELDDETDRDVWGDFWQTCMRSDSDYDDHLAYIYWNPVKHKVAKTPTNYAWLSFNKPRRIRDIDAEKFSEVTLDHLIEIDDFKIEI